MTITATAPAAVNTLDKAPSAGAEMLVEQRRQNDVCLLTALAEGYHFSTLLSHRDRQGDKIVARVSLHGSDYIADIEIDGAMNLNLFVDFARVKGFPEWAHAAHDLFAHVEREIVTYTLAAALSSEVMDRYGVSPDLLLPL